MSETRVGEHHDTPIEDLHAVLREQLQDEHGTVPLYRANPSSRYNTHGDVPSVLVPRAFHSAHIQIVH